MGMASRLQEGTFFANAAKQGLAGLLIPHPLQWVDIEILKLFLGYSSPPRKWDTLNWPLVVPITQSSRSPWRFPPSSAAGTTGNLIQRRFLSMGKRHLFLTLREQLALTLELPACSSPRRQRKYVKNCVDKLQFIKTEKIGHICSYFSWYQASRWSRSVWNSL